MSWSLGELRREAGLPESVEDLVEVGDHGFLVAPM